MNAYRFEHFGVGIALTDFSFSRQAADTLPDQTLIEADGPSVALSALWANRPLVLVTGSLSCPMTTSALPDLIDLEKRYRDRVNFALVYVREGHPGENIPQPHTPEEKRTHAQQLRDMYGIDWPVLVDDIDGTLHAALDTKPNSIHVVAPGGDVIYRALFAGDTAAAHAIAKIADGYVPRRRQSQARLGPILRAASVMNETLLAAGRRAFREVALAAPPMIVLGFFGRLFRRKSTTKRRSILAP